MATIKLPEQLPSPAQDSETLRKALDGFMHDGKAVIKVLCHRNATQRKLIRKTYQELYNQDLIDTLQSTISHNFGKAVVWWTYGPSERDARMLKNVLSSKEIGTKEQLQVIVEISCASSPHHLLAVRKWYCSLYHCSLEEDIIAYAPPFAIKILVALVSSFRYDGEVVDLNLANEEASMLQEAVALKRFDQDHVVWILSTRNVFQLKATFEAYYEKFGNHLSEDIKDFGNDLLESLIKDVIACIASPEKHFVEVIKAATDGWGTDEDLLSRVIVSRAEVDLMKVREAYSDIYKTSLDQLIKDETSGDYGAFLMALLGN
ncbi:unnamed protein product [Lactuca saligna]|uniref:Annexin n=1 Tax=Lactuca saligna TaxID=75948 RepID=A0AA35ZVD9_LACSI|nr:unnamed protein product [Lactuca saligna]